MPEPPIRVCCMTRHRGLVCPDGTFMCCICFAKVRTEDAWTDDDGVHWDMCVACGARNSGNPS